MPGPILRLCPLIAVVGGLPHWLSEDWAGPNGGGNGGAGLRGPSGRPALQTAGLPRRRSCRRWPFRGRVGCGVYVHDVSGWNCGAARLAPTLPTAILSGWLCGPRLRLGHRLPQALPRRSVAVSPLWTDGASTESACLRGPDGRSSRVGRPREARSAHPSN